MNPRECEETVFKMLVIQDHCRKKLGADYKPRVSVALATLKEICEMDSYDPFNALNSMLSQLTDTPENHEERMVCISACIELLTENFNNRFKPKPMSIFRAIGKMMGF